LEGKKMHLLNFKELTSQDLAKLVDYAIEIKHTPKKYAKTLEGKQQRLFSRKPAHAPASPLKLR
jgi:ornithine carbamoyltransferase